MKFEIDKNYTLTEIRKIAGNPGTGGKWIKGYLEHDGEMFILANTKTPGFGGQKYSNKWLSDDLFEWSGNNESKETDSYIQKILDLNQVTHLFTRDIDYRVGAELTYHGKVKAINIKNSCPVILQLKLLNIS